MPPFSRRLDLLRALPRHLRAPALERTLPHAGPHERDALVAEALALLERHPSRELLAGLFASWALLSPAARAAVLISQSDRLGELMAAPGAARDAGAARLAARVAIACVLDPPPGGGLPGTGNAEADPWAAPLARAVDEALAGAAGAFPEQRTEGLMEAVARVAHAPGPRLRRWLEDDDHPGHLALRSAARTLPAPLLHARAVRWLAAPALRGVARDVLRRTDATSAAPAMERAHLLRTPTRASALRALGDGAEAVIGRGPHAGAGERARLGRLRWAAHLPLKPAARSEAISEGLTDPSPRVRLESVRLLSEASPSNENDRMLADFAFDEDASVAHAAVAALADARAESRRSALRATMVRLLRSPHAGVRALAGQEVLGDDPFGNAALLDRMHCPLSARRMLETDPIEFLAQARRRYAHADGPRRMALLGLAARLSVIDRFEAEVFEAIEGADERLASKAALLAPGLGRSETARTLLERALADSRARVRANAVEARLRVEPQEPRCAEWLRDDNARARANALRHRLVVRREAGADRTLAEMLADERPAHRLSALWVARRSRCAVVVNRVSELARHEPDPTVRDRARRCGRALLASMRHGWSASPAGVIVTRPVEEAA